MLFLHATLCKIQNRKRNSVTADSSMLRLQIEGEFHQQIQQLQASLGLEIQVSML